MAVYKLIGAICASGTIVENLNLKVFSQLRVLTVFSMYTCSIAVTASQTFITTASTIDLPIPMVPCVNVYVPGVAVISPGGPTTLALLWL